MLAEGHHSLAKSLFLGGVTRRFPDLQLRLPRRRGRVGGVALHRPHRALGEAQRATRCATSTPHHVDRDEFARAHRPATERECGADDADADQLPPAEDPAMLDEWAACGIERAEDIRDLFVDAVLLRLRGRRPA